MTEWTVLFDNPAGRMLALRVRGPEEHWVVVVAPDTDGTGTVWRAGDGLVVGYEMPLDPSTLLPQGRPDVEVFPGVWSLQHPQHRYICWPSPPAEDPSDVPDPRTYDVRDLSRAYLELGHWQDAPRRRWARRRYEALTRGLGIAGRGPADQPAEPTSSVDDFVRDIADRYWDVRSPFEGLLEAPDAVVVAYQRHREDVDRSFQAARDTLIAVLAVLVEAGWGVPPGATVSHDQLAEWGWDMDERRPEPVDDDW